MRSFVKRAAALAVALSMASSTLASAQEEDGKVSFSVQGDLVGSYIWRDFYQTGVSFQPTLSLGIGNFSLTIWGSTDLREANPIFMPAAKEIDLTAMYTFGSIGPALSVASLWWAGQGSCRYFDFKSYETDHHLGAGLAYILPVEKLPSSITWSSVFVGQGKDKDGSQNHSSCVELNFPFAAKGVSLSATCDVLPCDAGITTYGGNVNSGFAITSAALRAMKNIEIMDSFSLPIFTQTVWNPHTKDTHLVLGILLKL